MSDPLGKREQKTPRGPEEEEREGERGGQRARDRGGGTCPMEVGPATTMSSQGLPALEAEERDRQKDPGEVLMRMEDFFASPEFTTALGEFMGNQGSQVQVHDEGEEQPIQ